MFRGLSFVSLLLPLLLFVTCKELPTDPFDDPRNLKIDFFLSGNKVTAFAGDSIQVGVTINIPKLVKSLISIDGEENTQRVLTLKDPLSNTPDTILFKTLYKTSGSKIITIKAMLTDNMATDYPFEIAVFTPTDKVIFDTIPPKDTTVFDTKAAVFRIVSHTVPSTTIKYSLSSSPTLPDSCYKIEGTGTALISVIPPKPGVYGLKITASNETVKDSFMMTMNVIAAPVLPVTSTSKTAQAGVADTLTFTGLERDSLTLENPGSYKAGEITVIPTGLKNVMKIVFTPQESKVYTFSVRVTGVSTDNIRYNDIVIVKHAVIGADLSVWKQDTLSMSAAENSVISKSIDSLLVNNSLTDVSFGCDKGTIAQRVWSDTIRWGARVVDTIVIIANYKGNAYPLKMFINVSAADVSLPKIVLVEPSTADATISSNVITCKFTITDSLSGIGNVVFRIGTTVLSDTLHSGDTYQCTVKDLPKGVKTIVTVEAIDKSQKKNAASKEISLTYNPDVQDNVGPVISLKNPLTASFTVPTPETSLLLQCKDQSGISSVTAKKGSTALTVQKVDTVFSIPVTSLVAGKTDTIVVTAIDSSAALNVSTLTVYVRYEPSMLDTKGPVITLKTPANNASVGVPSVTMSIVCRDESNIATVNCKLGTVTGIMTKENDSTFTSVISGLVSGKNQITITAKDASVNSNSSESTFTITYDPTVNDTVKPVISCLKAVRDTLNVNTASTTIEVLCTDTSGIDKVVCAKGTSAIPVTPGSGNLYSAAVSGLTTGANTFVFTATDKASKANSAVKTIVVMYDPTATDLSGPIIKLSSPAQDRSKVALPSAKLVVVCKDDNGISAVNYTFGSLSGAMTKDNDTTYSVALANLVKGDNQITILATDASSKKNANDTVFTIVYDPTMNDNAAPVITLKTPEKDSTKVSSKSSTIEVVCTDSSGVDTVTCKMGASDIPVVKGAGGVYSASVTTLAVGANTLTFTATDKASTKHSSVKMVTVIYDPSMTDNVPPTVAIKNPQNADQRIVTDTVTVQIDCSDESRISSVTAMRGGVAVSGITNAGSLYSVKVATLTAGKSDTITFKVVDSSSNKNSKNYMVVLRYNRKPIAAMLGTPADGATGVAKSPTFTWTDGTDPDGDAVTYTLRYGTSETALSKAVPNLTAKTATLSAVLSTTTKYYWQVVTHTAVNGDSAVSGIASFTTVEDAPEITAEPESKRAKVSGTAIFAITAKGLNLKYQWQRGTANVTAGTGGTTASYTTAAIVAEDNASIYRCIVTNAGGADTSASVILTVVYSVTYNGNGSTSPVPTDDATYASGEEVTVKSNTGVVRDGYDFTGWNTAANGSGTARAVASKFAMGNGNVTLYAQWKAIPKYTVTYDGNGSDVTGNVPVDNSSYLEGAPVKVAVAGNLARNGFTFNGWNTAANGSGTSREVASTFAMGNANVTLFAQWKALPTYTVTYIANTKDAGNAPVDNTKYLEGAKVIVADAGTLVRNGYKLTGWNTSELLSGTTRSPGSEFVIGSASVVLYAVWVSVYTVTFDGNAPDNGTAPSQLTYVNGATITMPGVGSLQKTGCTFSGWNTQSNGLGTDYTTGMLMPTNNITVYAKWTVTDNSGYVYNTVTIGNQTWMVQNLKTHRYKNGESIANFMNNEDWLAAGIGAYCWYGNDISNRDAYGALYNRNAVNDSRGLAPAGWRIPTDADWTTLSGSLGGVSVAGGKLKEAGTGHWATPNRGATNSSGFMALPGGMRNGSGNFSTLGQYGQWWTSMKYVEGTFESNWFSYLTYDSEELILDFGGTDAGFSIRLVRN